MRQERVEFVRVAMLGWEFPPFMTGGLGVHCFELTMNLAKLGINVDFFLPKQRQRIPSPHERIRIIEVEESPEIKAYASFAGGRSEFGSNYSQNLIKAVDAYARFLAGKIKKSKARYDLIHCHDWLTIPAGVMAKHATRLPLVLTVHSTEFDRNPFPWKWVADVEALGIQRADKIITVSNRMKQQLVEKYNAPQDKIEVVYNGVDYKKYWGTQLQERKEKIVLFLGRLTHQKGPEQFLRAAKKVSEFDKDARFIIAGEGDLLPRLLQLSIDLGISGIVSFTGFIPENEKRVAYALCDVYVMPSVSEPFGITALEAMASGTPCIISKTSGVSEVTKSCLLVDFWDVNEMAAKIIALLKYPVVRRVMAENEFVEVQEYGWDSTARKTADIYLKVESRRQA